MTLTKNCTAPRAMPSKKTTKRHRCKRPRPGRRFSRSLLQFLDTEKEPVHTPENGPQRRISAGAAAAVGLALWPSRVSADVGIPMLLYVWPASWILFVPIVLIEAVIARSVLVLPLGRSLRISFVANLVSTVVGIPLAWIAALIVELLLAGIGAGLHAVTRGYIPESVVAIAILTLAWIGPESRPWAVPAAALVLCVPFFFASVYCERRVARRMVSPELYDRVRHWSWRANLVSYGVIAVLLLAFTIYSLVRR